MLKYICSMCNYVYNEESGDEKSGILRGTKFQDLPDDWCCPVCGAVKAKFYQSYGGGPRRRLS
ncbi:MAG: rubredoxin [Candidatus Eremiobacterota bacterium]